MTWLKKMIRQMVIINSTLIASLFLYAQPTHAAGSSGLGVSMTDQLLHYIANTTYAILEKMNTVPAYIESLTEMALSWLDTTDNGNTIANNQYAFANLTAAYNATQGVQWDFTQNLTNQFLLAGSIRPSNPQLPINANDLTYSIMNGSPLIKGDSNDFSQNVKNYIANAAGMGFIVPQPDPNWKDSQAKLRYVSFYNTVSAIESYNAYLISGLYNQQTKTQASAYLIAQASSSDWFKLVATESLGMVLRHLLMYTSESYVTLNRSVELQQQQLAAQAMTNTLLGMLGAHMVGTEFASKAIQSSK